MKARTWKRIGAGLSVALLATAGVLLWRSRREAEAKAVLAAEIRAERAARKWPADPVPTVEERETADLYLQAVSMAPKEIWEPDEMAFDEALDTVPWTSTPAAVTDWLSRNAECLAILDAATSRNTCRFAGPAIRGSGCSRILYLLSGRGHATLAEGDAVAAAADVRRLVRVGRDLAAAPRPGDDEDGLPWAAMSLLRAEQDAARLLSATATAPNLPPEAGPALAAAARGPWGTLDANQRMIDANEDASDAWALRMLGPDARAWLDKMDAQAAELADLMKPSNQDLLEKAEDRIRRMFRRGTPLPKAAEVRAYREVRTPIVVAMRRRDIAALAPDSPLDKSGRSMGFLSPRWFRHSLADEARVAVARAAAEIRALQLRDGRAPRDLAELVPSVLPEVPLDPFDGKPLLYEVEGEAWRVASRVWRDPLAAGEGNAEDYPPAEVRFPRRPK